MKTLLYVVGALCVVGLAWWVIPVTKEPAAAPSAPKPPDAKAMQDFVVHPIRFAPFCFWTTQFPSCDFDDPETVRGLIGPYTITCSFYDGEGKPVTSAEKPGRYAAVVEVHRSDGVTSKRFVTLCRLTGEPSRPAGSGEPAAGGQPTYMQPTLLDAAGIDKDILAGRAGEFGRLTRTRTPDNRRDTFPRREAAQKEAAEAVMVAVLHDLTALKAAGKPLPDDTLNKLDRQWWVDFKRHYYGYDEMYSKEFVCPAVMKGKAARVLRDGTPAEAGMKDDAVKTIDAACEAWVNSVHIGFSLCVVRHGVVVVNKGYGKQTSGPNKDEPYTASTRGPLASATKFLSSILLAEFVDQGLVGLDEPVANYVPALRGRPTRIPGRLLTVRDGYIHIGGFPGTQWGDLMNDLEEVVADLYPTLEVGVRHQYEGTSLALGGKIMEMMSGESLPRLYRKHLFDPLGCRDTDVELSALGSTSTAIDLARIGQMTLNGGAYGDKRFFHSSVLRAMMPIPGRDRFNDDATIRWGVGIKQFDIDGLSEEAYGHPGASGSCVAVDPTRDLVIAMTRFEEGPGSFSDFLKKKSVMYKAILDSIKE